MTHIKSPFTCLLALCLFVPIASSQSPEEQNEVPSHSSQAEAREAIAEVFGPKFKGARTASDKQALVKEMLKTAQESPRGTASRYALLDIAKDISAQIGDVQRIAEVIDELEQEFAIDEYEMSIDAMLVALKAPVPTAMREQIFLAALKLANEGIAIDNYEQTKKLLEAVSQTTKSVSNSRIRSAVGQMMDDLKEIEAAYKSTREIPAILSEMPTDAAANQALGEFLCFMKGEWSQGLPYLALAQDARLQHLAEMEIQKSPDGLKIADGWWDVSAELEGRARTQSKLHAITWYKNVQPRLTGLDKARVDKRLSEEDTASSHASTPRVREKQDLAKVNLTGHWRSIASANVFYVRDNGGDLSVTLENGQTMTWFQGGLKRDGAKLTSSLWEAIMKPDVTKAKRNGSFVGTVTGPKRIEARITNFSFDRTGKFVGTYTGRTVWIKQDSK